jgi:tetratricopeptide (TPR) repeat protein
MVGLRSVHKAKGDVSPAGRRPVQSPTRGSPRPVSLLAGALILLLVGGVACGHKKSPAQLANDALQAGLQAQKAGNLQEAAADYREVLKQDPNNKFAHYDLALIDQTQGNNLSAEAGYQRALQIDPDFGPALFNLAIVETALGDTDQAVTLYRHVIELDQKNAGAHLNLGLLLRQLGQTKEAARELEIAVQLDPTLASRIPSPQATESPSSETSPGSSTKPGKSASSSPNA